MLPNLDFNLSNLILSIKITKQLYFVQETIIFCSVVTILSVPCTQSRIC